MRWISATLETLPKGIILCKFTPLGCNVGYCYEIKSPGEIAYLLKGKHEVLMLDETPAPGGGEPNNKQWPTVTDNDFRKIYRALEVAVERLNHNPFLNGELTGVLQLILNENKHFKQ